MFYGKGLPSKGFPGGISGKELVCQCKRHTRRGFDPWARKISWRRTWQPTPIFVPGESHGQRILVGYSPWGLKELDMTEAMLRCVRAHTHTPPRVPACLLPDAHVWVPLSPGLGFGRKYRDMVEGKTFKMGKNCRPTCGLFCCVFVSWGLAGSSDSKQSACNAEDPGSIPGFGRSSEEGNGSSLQYSCLENPMDRGAQPAPVHGVAKSRTRLSV